MHAPSASLTTGFLTPEMLRSTYRPIINSDRPRRRDNGWLGGEGNERTFYRGGEGPEIFKIVPRSEEKNVEISWSGPDTKRVTDKEAFSYKVIETFGRYN